MINGPSNLKYVLLAKHPLKILNIEDKYRTPTFSDVSGPWQFHGSVAGPGSHPGWGNSGGLDGQQGPESIGEPQQCIQYILG